MNFEFMTREVFDTLILTVVVIGLALAGVRLYRDFTRPLPPLRQMPPPVNPDDDTQPNAAVSPDQPPVEP
jgi:hypothetical protein